MPRMSGPTMSSSHRRCRSGAARATCGAGPSLATVRGAIEQYRAQHNSVYPGDVATKGTCSAGNNIDAAADSLAALNAQLQSYTNAAGVACDTPSPDFKYGPYLRQGIPNEPVTNKTTVAITTSGAPIKATADGGWAYDTRSGQFIANNTANDTGSPQRQYSQH